MNTNYNKVKRAVSLVNGKVLAAGIVATAMAGRPAQAAWNLTATLKHSTAQAGSHTGFAVAYAGDDIAAGAPDRDYSYFDQGEVATFFYLGVASSWFQSTTPVRDTGGDMNALFGHSVDWDADWLIVGAPGEDLDKGLAYIQTAPGSLSKLNIDTLDRQSDDLFGWSVAMDDGIAVVSAIGDDEGGNGAGAAYIFKSPYSTYKKVKGGGAGYGMGNSVAVDGGRVAVGIIGSPARYGAVGVVKIYEESGGSWVNTTTLHNPDAAMFNFGTAVAISGDIVVVGAHSAASTGRAYVFDLSVSVMNPKATLQPSDGGAGDYFGASVAVFEDYVLVGAPYHDPTRLIGAGKVADAGAAYLFDCSSGACVQDAKFAQRIISRAGDLMGWSVAMDDCTAVVGAPFRDDTAAADTGVVYVYECQ